MKSLENFLKDVDKKSFDYDHVAGIQCVDLIKRYLKECFNIEIPNGFGNAIDYYKKYNDKKLLKDNFIRIENTPEFVPKAGDIFVWNEKRGKGNGHVAICDGVGDVHFFYAYDLNWNNVKKVKRIKHDYKNVLGVLRYNKKEEKAEIKEGSFVKVEVKFTGALNKENALVELNNNQFWIGLDSFMPDIKEGKYFIYGQVAFIKEKTSGIAFHYLDNKIKREFQLEIENIKLKGIK